MIIREINHGYHNTEYIIKLENGETPTNEEMFRFCDKNYVPFLGGSVSCHYGKYVDGIHRNVTIYTD